MEQANYIKAIVTAIFTVISSLLGVLAIPVIMLVGSNIVDYVTGLMASPYRDQDINSYKSIRGIFKKISMWSLVIVGAMMDELIMYTSMSIGKELPLRFVIACTVADLQRDYKYIRERTGYGSQYTAILTAIG